jgi:hypothetical protein
VPIIEGMPRRFVLSSDLDSARDERALRRSFAEGELRRLRQGVYLFDDEWEALDRRWSHIALVCAQLRTMTRPVTVSHASAAALQGFPVLDSWPSRVHVIDPRRATGQQTATLVRHPGLGVTTRGAPTIAHGVPCTPALSTAIDVGLAEGFLAALLGFAFGIRRQLFTLDEATAALAARGPARNVRAVREALGIASPTSDSAGESISKGTIHQLGFPPPEQQRRFPNPWGRDLHVDFWWAEHGIIGEFDGDQKYVDEQMRSGRTLEQVLLSQQRRADHLRAQPGVRNLVRWNYAAARTPSRLARILTGAGLPRGARP